MKTQIKKIVKHNKKLLRVLTFFYNMFSFNKKRANKNNHISYKCSFIKKSTLFISGKNNSVEIGDCCIIKNCKIYVSGNNNKIAIKSNCHLFNLEIFIEDSFNCVEIGKNTSFCGTSQLAAIEGTCIKVGDDCLFSKNFQIRTGDSHVILDKNDNSRINYSKDVVIGDRVWAGSDVTILKGVSISNDIIIGTHSLVTKSVCQSNCIFAGSPAKLIKKNVSWKSDRGEM